MMIKQKIRQFEGFEGTAKKITLVSNPCYFMLPPTDDSPKTQKLTITASGQVSFTSTDFYFPPTKSSRGEWRKTTLEKGVALDLIKAIVEPFRTYDITAYITDVGTWELIITNMEDRKYKYSGPLFADAFPTAGQISEKIRETLLMDDLLCFDREGNESIPKEK